MKKKKRNKQYTIIANLFIYIFDLSEGICTIIINVLLLYICNLSTANAFNPLVKYIKYAV